MIQLNELQKKLIMPSLRIVLTDICNGRCFFCHKEGNKNNCSKSSQLSQVMLKNHIIPAIQELGIQKAILTGGEPTLYGALPDVAREIKEKCPGIKLEMTTNGCNLQAQKEVLQYIDKITISVSSFIESIYRKYTEVDPQKLMTFLNMYPELKKAVSIVITKDNENDIDEMVSFFLSNGYDVKLQFVISNGKNEETWENENLDRLVNHFEITKLRFGAVPSLYKLTESGTELRIKLSRLNTYIYNNIFIRKECATCKNKSRCEERGCAVRVFPDGSVSPCLDQYQKFSSKNTKQNILDAYESMEAKIADDWMQHTTASELSSMNFLGISEQKFDLSELPHPVG